MDKIDKQLSKLEFIEDFRKQLKNRSYTSTSQVAITSAKIILEIIKAKDLYTNIDELLKLVKLVGKMFISVDIMQFTVGNVVKRILHFIHKEKANSLNTVDMKRTTLISFNTNLFNIKEKDTDTNNSNKISMKSDSLPNSFKNNNQILIDSQPFSTRNRSTIMDIARNTIIEEIIQLIDDLDQSHSLIVENADNHINDNDIILTANYSDQLHEFLVEASKSKSFNVIVAESYPSLKGLEMANKLFKSGIKTTLISDSSIFSIMPRISKVLIGTRSVMANGGLISYNGVYNICLAAQTFSIPVIVLSGSFKLTPMYPFDHETFNEQLSPDTIYNCKYDGDLSNITFNSPAYDYVPPEFISMFVTDKGDFHPSYMYRLFNEFYSQQDFYL